MRHVKKVLLFFLLATILFTFGCSNENSTPPSEEPANSAGTESDQTEPEDPKEKKPASEDEEKKELSSEEMQKETKPNASTPENDSDVGLKNIKIDSSEANLTPIQKQIIQYFDDDYLEVEEYEFLKRYAKLFTGVQVRVYGTVAKIISSGPDTYQFVCEGYVDGNSDGYSMVVTASNEDTRFIEGDQLSIYGLYLGEETVTVDGETWVLPSIRANSRTSIYQMGIVFEYNLYSLDYIKAIAEEIFGKDIEIRKPTNADEGFELVEDWSSEFEPQGSVHAFDWYYVVELEDQSKAKFSKYLFSREVGYIKDMKSSESIERNIEFSADFKHFFLFTYDSSLEILSLEYYDSDLNKIWEREFSETINPIYDYTKHNIYVLANNELHIINTKTGEDTYPPSYIGERYDIRKMDDGILVISTSKADAVMKLGLDGKIIWKTNLSSELSSASIQIVEDRIILGAYLLDDDFYMPHYIMLDKGSGEIQTDAVAYEQ